jgi:predicted ATPase/DNA-binding SARP family transcriptional activator
VRFGLLGPLAVWSADGSPVPVGEPKVRALLAALLIAHGRVVPVGRLVEDLWGGVPPGDPVNTLQTKVSQLRRLLGSPGSVLREGGGYRLPVDRAALDVACFRELVGRAAAAPADRVRLLDQALGLWRGPALADLVGAPFAAAVAAGWQEERLAAIESRADALLAAGSPDVGTALVAELSALAEQHPLRERLHGLLVRALYRAGRQSDALDVIAALRTRLVDTAGLEPGPELRALQQAVLAQDPTLDVRPGPAPRRSPPAPLSTLVGRAGDVRAVLGGLAAARLVTLTGPGGVGKTRLALAVAGELAAEVVVVELAGLDRTRAIEVADVVAAALDVRDGADDPGERIGAAVRDRGLVLLLDNCEQVVEPVAALVERLLRAAPDLRVLTTSREPVGVPGEVLVEVPPLPLPPDPGPGPDVAALADVPSVALFVARARAAAPGFALDPGTAPAVAAICRRLDGLPLALELAAGRVRALGVHGVLARLDDRFRLLAGGPRGAPARQRTLRAVIDWSWQLLDDAERAVLRRLAVHPEGCDPAAAEAVCSGADVPPDQVLDVLSRLVDRSLVVSRAAAGEPRFRLLESVGLYGLDRLVEAAEADRVRDRHARHFLALAERAAADLRGPGQAAALDLLDAEAANLRVALDHLLRGPDPDPALRLATTLTWYWFLRGRTAEAERSLRRALAGAAGSGGPRARARAWLAGLRVLDGAPATPDAVDPPLVGDDPSADTRTRWFLGYVLTTMGDLSTAVRHTAVALAAAAELDDRWIVAAALADRSTQALGRGRPADAAADGARAAALFAGIGDRWGQVQATFALGSLAEIAGDYRRAAEQHRAGLRTAEELGLRAEISYQLSWLGRVALLTGDLAGARRLHERARDTAVEHGFAPGRVFALIGLALGGRRAGDLDDAERQLREVLQWQRGLPDEPGNYLVLAELGFIAELRGDAEGALALQRRAGAIARPLPDPRAHALTWEGLAGAESLAGRPVEAARLLGAAAAARAGVGLPLPAAERGDIERITARITAAIGPDRFAAEHARGRTSG